METNFFHQVAALQLQGDLNITIRQGSEGRLFVSVLLNNDNCKDSASKAIPPIMLKGAPHELDEGFFGGIAAPIQATSQLFVNMEAYMKAQEKAQKESKAEKDKVAKVAKGETDNRSDKEKKFDAAIKKVDELEAEGKYKDAWMKVPDPSEYPEHSDMLRQRRESLSAKFPPSLF